MKQRRHTGSGLRAALPLAVLLTCFTLPCIDASLAHGTEQSVTPSPWRTDPGQDHFPLAGEDCAAIYDPDRHRVILFGGKTDEETILNETWELNLTNGLWENVTPPGLNPPPLEDHAVIYDPLGDRMILHGGEFDAGTTNGTWSLDLAELTWREITAPTAPRREENTAVYDSKRKRMVLYGGRDDARVNLTTLDALDLDPDSPTFEAWSQLEATGKKTPSGRVDHVAIYDPVGDRMVIFGGWDKEEDAFFDDTWSLSFAEGEWWRHARKVKSSKPPARRNAAAVYDAVNGWMLVFGGTGGGLLNDVWSFNLKKNSWSNLSPGPQPRKDHVAVFDPQSQRLLVYGGETVKNGPKLHDVWQFTPKKGERQN